ncbi:hypothetical protein GE061_006926 [Apolygus lucorum]|uniref:Uncharacterized protein n=1 Tax=Apolygus lucorum TaxID=248454 RepID=A0A6A4JNT4_APOLU|nr:hypothetical protein GE061_006926 [Apolygus lucorum]
MLNESTIKIYARVKPTTEAVNFYDIGVKDGKHESLVIHTTSKEKKDTGSATHSFKFQKVFRESAQQAELFDVVGRPVVQAVFSGYNGAILAYGQTGTGKTHSISGGTTSSTRGMIPRAFQQIFDVIAMDQANNSPREFSVAMSTLEIYNEQCIDLLSKDSAGPEEKIRVELREDAAGNVRLRNLKEYPVRNMQEVEKYLFQSMTNRVTADTPMNQHSSRSHCIFTLYLRQRVQGERKQVKSKLHMIDLSGSERVWKNRISGHSLYEAKHINLSLHYLEQVIIALNDPKRFHVPYRNSSITNFLRDSLGGNSRTAMVFTISLEPDNFYETLSTCRFSQRVSLVKNHTRKVIEYDKDEELDFLRLEVERLKSIIAEMIGEDQMKLRVSASQESVPFKPKNDPLDDTQILQTTTLTEENSQLEAKEDEKQEIETTPCSPRSVVQTSKLPPPSRESAKSSFSTNVPTECSIISEESDVVTKYTKSHSSSYSSTYLDEIYNLLSNEDPQKSEVLNINKLLAIIGLDLPFSDKNSGRTFTEGDQKEFKYYIELPQNREKLRVYVLLSIMFQRHAQNEKILIEKARSRHIALKEAEAKLNIDVKENIEDDHNMKEYLLKQDTMYQQYFKLIMESKKKRIHYIKVFTQMRFLLAEFFMEWKQNHEGEAFEMSRINHETERLVRWVHSLRHPIKTMDSECEDTLKHDLAKEDGDGTTENGQNWCEISDDYATEDEKNKALNEDFQRLDTWTWNLRNMPCKIFDQAPTTSQPVPTSDEFIQTTVSNVRTSNDDLNEDLQRLETWAWNLRNKPCKINDLLPLTSRPTSDDFADSFLQTAIGNVRISNNVIPLIPIHSDSSVIQKLSEGAL